MVVYAWNPSTTEEETYGSPYVLPDNPAEVERPDQKETMCHKRVDSTCGTTQKLTSDFYAHACTREDTPTRVCTLI